MANLEKQTQLPIKPIDKADFDAAPSHASSAHLIGSDVKNLNDVLGRTSPEQGRPPVILRLDLPVTPFNVERIRERVRLLNQKLEASGTQLRLRMI